jgi:hypothetical protein
MKEIMEKLKCSYFRPPVNNTKAEKKPAMLVIVYKMIIGNRLKALTDKVQACIGHSEQTKAKCRLPAITPSGIFDERKEQSLIKRTEVACVDLDGKDNCGVSPMMMRQKMLCDPALHPFMTFISPSGKGLKALIRYDTARHSLAEFMHALMQYLQDMLGLTADKSCVDVTRLCFLCRDTTATYNPDEPYTGIDIDFWLDIYNKNSLPPSPKPQLPAEQKEQKLNFECDPETLAHVLKVDALINKDITGGDYKKFMDMAFALASVGEVGRAVFLHCCSFYDGKQRYDLNKIFTDCNNNKRGTVTIATFFKMCADAGIDVSRPQNEKISVVELLAEKDDFNNLPMFPESVFNDLPPILDRFVTFYNTPAEKSMMLLAAITAISAVLPGVYVMYRHRRIEPNLFLYVFGKSGAGKGLLGDVKALLSVVDDVLEQNARNAMKAYKEDLRRANSGKRGETDVPDPPKIKRLYLSGNNTSSNIIRDMNDNGGRGFIFDSEGDAFVYNSKTKDCYNISDDLRKAAHHEDIEMDRVGDNKNEREHIRIKHPCLSMIISSTPSQMKNVFPNTENGFSARFNFFCIHQRPEWKDPYDETDEKSVYEVFYNEAKDIYCIYNKLKCIGKDGVRLTFTKEQRKCIADFFRGLFYKNYLLYDGDFDGTMYRLGITQGRIAMVLSALRYHSVDDFDHPLTCNEADITRSLEMIEVLEQHSTYAFRALGNENKNNVDVKNYYPQIKLMLAMPEEFMASDAVEVGKTLNINRNKVYKILGQLVDGIDGYAKMLQKCDHGKYRKIQLHGKEM